MRFNPKAKLKQGQITEKSGRLTDAQVNFNRLLKSQPKNRAQIQRAAQVALAQKSSRGRRAV